MVNQTPIDYESLYKWIDSFPISRHKKNISRDFSDAMPLAEILKSVYPKLVEMHNYTPRNAVALKIVNWDTLNKKVLNKLGVNLSKKVIDQLANSKPGVIEKVLHEIKQKIDEKEEQKKAGDASSLVIEGLSADLSGTVMSVKEKDSDKTVDHKLIPISQIEKMEQDLQEKEETITVFKNKVQHLENLLSIKDERINDLTRQLEQLSKKSDTTMESSRLLRRIF